MDEIASDDLTQVVMIDLVRQLAATLVALALYEDRYTALPEVANVLMSELAANLTERGVPAQVAAGLLGISRRSFFRHRALRPSFGSSLLGEIVALLAESPRSKEELLLACADDDVAALESTLRFLVERRLVMEAGGRYELLQTSAGDDVQDIETVLETIASNELPVSIADLAVELGQDPRFVERAIRRLAGSGRLMLQGDTVVGGPGAVELVSTSHRAAVLGMFHTTRTFLTGVRRRLDEGREHARTLTWRFSHPSNAKLRDRIQRFTNDLDDEWTRTERDEPAARTKFTAMVSWFDE